MYTLCNRVRLLIVSRSQKATKQMQSKKRFLKEKTFECLNKSERRCYQGLPANDAFNAQQTLPLQSTEQGTFW